MLTGCYVHFDGLSKNNLYFTGSLNFMLFGKEFYPVYRLVSFTLSDNYKNKTEQFIEHAWMKSNDHTTVDNGNWKAANESRDRSIDADLAYNVADINVITGVELYQDFAKGQNIQIGFSLDDDFGSDHVFTLPALSEEEQMKALRCLISVIDIYKLDKK